MANTFSPQGFKPVRRVDGAAWTGNLSEYKIAKANTHSFFMGDPVVRLSTGYIDVTTTEPTEGIQGIFMGCKYLSIAQGREVWSKTFPGGDANGDVTAYVVDDPNVVFQVWVGTGSSSAAGGPVAFADLGNNIDYKYGSGNTLSGISGAYVDYATKATTNTLPFVLWSQVTDPPGWNGTDTTTAGNLVEVVFNNAALKVGQTGV